LQQRNPEPTMHTPSLTRLSAAVLATSLLAGCVSTRGLPTAAQVRQQQNPADRAQAAATHFTPALRCMDEMMFTMGTRDVTLMMEELRDATQKVPVSARDMLTSAISDMTRRSRAVRLSVFGSDQGNLAQVLQQAQKTTPFAVVPEFNVRGSISQFDEDVRRQTSSFGLLAERFGVRFGSEARFSVLGFDAAMVRTDTMTLVPGVASKNTTVIAKRDASAGDGQARLLGAGAVFSFDTGRAEGTAQAARNMVELAAIELVGKLIRAPYWQCLGHADQHPDAQREMDDWFLSMDEDERVVFVKERLRERRWFNGALDGTRNAGFESALGGYRRAMGLPAQGELDLEFFKRFVTQRVAMGPLAPPAPKGAATTVAVAPQAEPAPAPVTLDVALRRSPAGRTDLQVSSSAAGYVYCYVQDPATDKVRRIFPNRFVKDPRVEAGATISVPGTGRFRLDAQHRFACIQAPLEVYNGLPPALRWGDFDEVRLPGFEQIRQAFAQTSGQPVTLAQARPLEP